jgi:FKBP-type peptidyl-prolyl cis-trans isomerase
MLRPIAFAAVLAWSPLALAAPVILPGLSYEVLGSGPATGAHPTRADGVTMRYVGRLADGAVFSTSPDDGKGLSSFGVKEVIPGMSAVLQLMRPGDRWRVTMPPYLAYGPGRPLTTPASTQTVQKQGIPPNATLVFDVELVGIIPPKAP